MVPSYIQRSKLYFPVLKTDFLVPIHWSEAALAPFGLLEKPAAYRIEH